MLQSLPNHLFHCSQIYRYEKARGSGFRSKDACDFAVKPEDGRVVKAFSCEVKFQQEDDDQEHSFSVYPGFTPLKVERLICCNSKSLLLYTEVQWTERVQLLRL